MIRVRAECEQLSGSEQVKTFETDRKGFRNDQIRTLPNIHSKSKSCRKFQRRSFLPPACLPHPCSGQAAVASQQVANMRPPPRLREHETWAYIGEDTYVPVKR